jgi:TolA-binding protein
LAFPQAVAAQSLKATLSNLGSIEADTQQLRRSQIPAGRLASATFVEERLTDGALYYNLKDYVRASIILTDIADNHQGHRAYPEALFLLGDSLYLAGDYFGARTRFNELIERSSRGGFGEYVHRALGRLLEIAVRVRDFEGVEGLFERVGQTGSGQYGAAAAYYRAKYLYSVAVHKADDSQGDVVADQVDAARLEQARAAFEAIPASSPFHPKAVYFVGVIHTLRGELTEAAAAFRRVSGMTPKTDEQKRVVELARLAIGRIEYEADRPRQAVEAYQTIPRSSGNFDSAAYEAAWAHLRQGDALRAERSLEILSIAVPDSRHIPDGNLLRGELLTRDGRFGDATTVFKKVGADVAPVRAALDRVVEGQEDPEAHFRSLVTEHLDQFDVHDLLPPLALRWARIEGEMERALTVIGDLRATQRLVRETETIATRLRGALGVPNPVNLFPELRTHAIRLASLRARLMHTRRALIAMDAKATSGLASQELVALRQKRRAIERKLEAMPTDVEELRKRIERTKERYDDVAEELNKIEVELLGLDARIVAIEHFLETTAGRRDEGTVKAVLDELVTHRAAVLAFRERVKKTALQIEVGRLQVGVGDAESAQHEALRVEHVALVKRERALLASLGARLDPRLDAALLRVAKAEAELDRHGDALDAAVDKRISQMERVLAEEEGKLDAYRIRMAALRDDGEVAIAKVTYQHFKRIRRRFYELALRADVGLVDVAWAKREEHRMRAELLTRQRARALKILEDEYRDIVEEGR